MRIDREASLSLSLQQHQQKQNHAMESRISELESSSAVKEVWQSIWSRFDCKTSSIEEIQERLSTLEILTNENVDESVTLSKMQECIAQVHSSLMGYMDEKSYSLEKSFGGLVEEFNLLQVEGALDKMILQTTSNHHNAKLDKFMHENTNLLQLMYDANSQQDTKIEEMVVRDTVDTILNNIHHKMHEKNIQELLKKEVLFQSDLERLVGSRPFEQLTTYQEFIKGEEEKEKALERQKEQESEEQSSATEVPTTSGDSTDTEATNA